MGRTVGLSILVLLVVICLCLSVLTIIGAMVLLRSQGFV